MYEKQLSRVACTCLGYETTANTLAFTTYSLAANPDKAAKLVEVLASPKQQNSVCDKCREAHCLHVFNFNLQHLEGRLASKGPV